MAYSKGPWTFSIEDGGTYFLRDADGQAMQCDEQYYPWVSGNEDDWKLMAAAPEMAEMLHRIYAGGDNQGIEALLKKVGVLP